MRELKFRAYIKPLKRYATGLSTIQFHKCCDVAGAGIWSVVTVNEGIFEEDGIVIEQYTGLEDRNGKEIYEGDIIRTKSCDQPNFSAGAIEMVQQMYLIMNSAHYRDPELTHCEPLGHYCDTEVEVIGNIHENPELVKEKECTLADFVKGRVDGETLDRIAYKADELQRKNLSEEEKAMADKAAKLIARDYGEVIKKLGDE